jgi:ribosomal protein L37AE/L43A
VSALSSILGRAAAWPASYLHRLPDDAFLHVEPGGKKDPTGRTTPRSLRHLPILDADGLLDLPHLRDAMAQLPNAGPWLPSEVRDTLIAKATKLHKEALSSTHKAARGLPDWALGYVAHLDRHEALGVSREDAHKAWGGDGMIGRRASEYVKAYKRGGVPVTKAKGEDESLTKALRSKVAKFNARVGDQPGMKVSLATLTKAHARGMAAYDATVRPVAKSRDQWGMGRVNALLRLTASGKPDHPSYTGDHDLLPVGHPRATRKAEPSKPGASVTRPKPPAPPPPAAPAPKPKVTAKPPKGKAPLPVASKPVEKDLDLSALGEDPARTGGTPWPDMDLAWLSAEAVPEQLDTSSYTPRHDALLATNASGDVDSVNWRLDARVVKDEMAAGDLAAGGQLAPDQSFKETTFGDIPVVLDRPKGTVQTGVDKDGKPWSRTFLNDNGYVPATLGGDGEELDVFIGPDPDATMAYVAVQVDDDGAFDELKVFLGYPDEASARACYVAHIPERYLSELYPVPLSLLQGMLGLEPDGVTKTLKTSTSKPRSAFGIGPGNRVHVKWPTTVYSDPAFRGEKDPSGDPASSAKGPSTDAPQSAPESGAAPESPGSVAMAAKRAKALGSITKAGATYEGAKPLPPELSQHPALTAAPTETYPNPDETGGWLYVIDGEDTPSHDPSWIAFVDTTGKALLWTSRDENGGVNGAPYQFQRPDLIKPKATKRNVAQMQKDGIPEDVCPTCGAKMMSSIVPEGTQWKCPKCGAVFIDEAATRENFKADQPDVGMTRLDGLQLGPDELEAAAKAARAVQSMLPAGPVRAIHKLPAKGETEKGMDDGTLLYSPTATLDDPAALASLLASLSNAWLGEYPDSPRARKALAKAGRIFVHKDVPGSIFVASYELPAGVDVFDAHPDAGDDEATTWQTKTKARMQGPDADVLINARPPGEPPSPDADRGLPPGLTDGAVTKGSTNVVLTIETNAVGYDALKPLLANIEKLGAPGHSFGIIADESTTGYPMVPKDGKGDPIKLGGWDGDGGAYVKILDVEKVDATKGAEVEKAFTFVAIGKDAEGQFRDERYVLGPVLIPDVVDLQGDRISAAEVEATERRWMERYQNLGWQHEAEPDQIDEFRQADDGGKVPLLASDKAVLVESYIVRSDAGFVMINGRKVTAGTWLMGVIYKDDALWAEVKSGKRTGFSIGGYAKRTPVDGAPATTV